MSNQNASHKFTCPSAPLNDRSKILGIVNENGEVNILPQTLDLDKEFIQIAKEGKEPEKRFRFANKCVESACQQWTGSSCGVVTNVLDKIEQVYWKEHLPKCSIRDTCRWFHQEKENACKVCPLVRYKY